ncbi:ribosome small subunit-dependent GTPase A [Modestobacter sp. Leaf380]|uniref:ribosome small subunit-dependent GTPase A n=1 Tax=Modestobacter sp. Leaf380 TaxID=1736356 RepID=UPI0006FEAD2F|nr:ribosome small subunit-dependent GTPase A [Modestobacter sp. Leaf380]KQS63880.1 ribosome small subunit-dependent GTPase [Modestobacter sp. Leaf380]
MEDLAALGWTADRATGLPGGTRPARVTRVDRGLLTVDDGAVESRLPTGRAVGPVAVGDWVAVGEGRAVAVLPRTSAFTRTVAGRGSDAQVVAANLDLVLVVDSLTGAARLRRVERYLAVAWSSGARPVVVLTKADLCAEVGVGVATVAEDAVGVEVLAVSAVTGAGLDALGALLTPGTTAALVGPSGVGKSSLANALAGELVATTAGTREDGRGRHTTTARQLHRLPGGALLVDTPGMRELALHDDAGLGAAYADVTALAAGCRFRDCAHRTEPGCAVAAGISDGTLDPARYTAWRTLQAQAHRQELRADAKARALEHGRLRARARELRRRPSR